ncbi:sigma 54-interacting transcriptional regulator [Fusibacter sp. JL216-2]|uniref:sigma-54 interaction domain-containing protein n=1 Tax=Fusibacter sp. JL216-2 TaxID=3071453 RepID=UPI003D349701
MDNMRIHGLDTLMEHVREGIICVRENGSVVLANTRACEIIGMSLEKMNGVNLKFKAPFLGIGDATENKKFMHEDHVTYEGDVYVVSTFPIRLENEASIICCVFNNLVAHQKLKAKVYEDSRDYDVLDVLMNTLDEWVVVVDENGIITRMSKAYKDFNQDQSPEGKHVTDVIENTRMHKVIEAGVPELNDVQYIRGNKMVANRVPIKRGDRVIGAVGKVIFKDLKDFYTLSNKISTLQSEVAYYKEELGRARAAKYSFDMIIGGSEATEKTKSMARRAAKTDSNVLIIGESGTGKELFAHAIHNDSSRRFGPFVKVNCAAIPGELLESELFGYESGAFTGARKDGKKGKFELANKGTILLDEIGEMPIEMQVKLLRVLQEREIDRVGGQDPIKVDVRIIASTNKVLEDLVEEGLFREDLFYRLNVMRINLTPIRERIEEIPSITEALIVKLTERLGLYVSGISPEAMNVMMRYEWPGNIRELENVLERAINLLDDDLFIKAAHLPDKLIKNKYKVRAHKGKLLQNIIEEMEKEIIQQTLEENDFNKNKTAKILGISRAGLYNKISQYHIKQ